MKKLIIAQAVRLNFIAFVMANIFAIQSYGQIVFEQSFPYSGTMTRLEKDGAKFYLMDVPAQECRLYNLDYSLFKEIKLDIPSNMYLYDIQFVTQNLFDSDDGIELLYVFYQYVQTPDTYYYIYTTRIADENGSILLDLPGASWTEIKNGSGTDSRMLNFITDYSVYPYPVETRIYRLPGQLTDLEGQVLARTSDDKFFPNPTTGLIGRSRGGFNTDDQADWVILDSTGKLIARCPLQDTGDALDLRSLGLADGCYLVRLESKNFQTKFQQIVLSN